MNEVDVAAPPQRVWEVLSDARSYAEWVVSAREVREVEGRFPQKGSRFRHVQGIGPASITDWTSVLECEPLSRLVLRAGLGPFGAARVELTLHQRGDGGTRVTMREIPDRGLARIGYVAGFLALRGRNSLSLDRLKRLAEASG